MDDEADILARAAQRTDMARVQEAYAKVTEFLRHALPTLHTDDGSLLTELVYRCHSHSFKVAYAKEAVQLLLGVLSEIFALPLPPDETQGAFGGFQVPLVPGEEKQEHLLARVDAVFLPESHSAALAKTALLCTPVAERHYQNWDAHHLTLLGGALWALTGAAAVVEHLARQLQSFENREDGSYLRGIAFALLQDVRPAPATVD